MRRNLIQQTNTWLREDDDFQHARQRKDLSCRQRVAAMLMECQLRHRQRAGVRAEITRIENMLLGLEETFATSRQRLHEYDQRLTAAIQDKESLLAGLVQAISAVKGQMREVDANTLE